MNLLIVCVLLIFVLPEKIEAYQAQITIYDGPPIAVSVPQRSNESISITITAANAQKFYSSVNSTTNYVERTSAHNLTSSQLTLGEDIIRVKAVDRKGVDVAVTNMRVTQFYSIPDVPSINLTETDNGFSKGVDYSFDSVGGITYAAWIYGYYEYEVDETHMRSFGTELRKATMSTFYQTTGSILTDKNGIYTFFIKNEEGYTAAKHIEINSYDETAPIITVTDTGSGKTKNPILMNVDITDTSLITTKKWAFGSKSATYFGTSGTSFSGNQIEITQNGTYTIFAKDEKGNQSIKTFVVSRITTPETNPPIINVNVAEDYSFPGKQMGIQYEILDESLLVSKKIGIGIRNTSYFQNNGKIIPEIGTESVLQNGYYTIYAKDDYGNESVKTVLIEGLDESYITYYGYVQMVGSFDNGDKAIHYHGEMPVALVDAGVYVITGWINYQDYLYYRDNYLLENYRVNFEDESQTYLDHFENITSPNGYTSLIIIDGVMRFDYLDSIDQFPIYDILEDEIIVENNGSIIESESHSTIVNIKNRGYANTMYSQYQWTTSSLFSSTSPYNWTDFISGDNIQNSGISGDYYLHITTMDEEGNEKNFVSNKFVFKEIVENQLFDLGNIDFGIITLTTGFEQKVKAKSSLNKIEFVQGVTNEQNYQITMAVAPFSSASGSQIDANNFKILKSQSINSSGTQITGSYEFQNNTPVTMVTSNSQGFYDPTHLIINNEDIELTIPTNFIPNIIGSETLTSSITYSVTMIP